MSDKIVTNIILNQLLVNGISDTKILDIFKKANKDLFVPSYLKGLNTCDCVLFFKNNRFILENSTLAFMLQIANIQENSKVLVVGADLGFSLYIISLLSKNVICIEEDSEIIDSTKENLLQLGVKNVQIYNNTLLEGYKKESPYDLIFINGAYKNLPISFVEQINFGGKIVGVERKNNLSKIVMLEKFSNNNTNYQYYKHSNTPYLEGLKEKTMFKF